MSTPPLHQVLIIGGGLVGSSLAIALHQAGIDTALVETTPPDALPAVFDQRNLSFAEATVNALRALGILPRLRQPGGSIRRIQITRRGDFGRIWLRAKDYGRAEFGQIVIARDFGDALESALAECTTLTRYRPARFVGFGAPDENWREVRLVDDTGVHRIRARLVIAADGTSSAVRTSLGIPIDEHDYQQRLLNTRLHAARYPDGTAWERLTEHGPTAVLPRGDGDYGLVHTVDEAEAETVLALSDTAFLDRVQRIFGWRIGKLLEVGPRSAHPLRSVVARRVLEHRVALVGNAAQTLHPIGAQGFNLGLRDALLLAELAATAEDPGNATLLHTWARQRTEDRKRTLGFSDGLARLTANPFTPLRLLRSLGLAALDRIPLLQTRLASGAMGYRGQTPLLCRARETPRSRFREEDWGESASEIIWPTLHRNKLQ